MLHTNHISLHVHTRTVPIWNSPKVGRDHNTSTQLYSQPRWKRPRSQFNTGTTFHALVLGLIQKTLEVLSLLRPNVHDTSKTAKITCFILVLHWAVDVIEVIYYIHGQWSNRIKQVIFAVLDVSWTMGLNTNSDKTSKVFCINICCFSTRFYIFCTTVAQSSKFHENYRCFWSLHPIKPERSLRG